MSEEYITHGDGEYNIACRDWAFATVHYDYRYTNNAERHDRAERIVSISQREARIKDLIRQNTDLQMANNTYLERARTTEKERDAVVAVNEIHESFVARIEAMASDVCDRYQLYPSRDDDGGPEDAIIRILIAAVMHRSVDVPRANEVGIN